MDLKKISLFVIAFILEIIFLSKDLRFKNDDSFSSNDVDVEFVDSTSYFISEDGVDRVLISKKIEQFPRYKVFINPVATLYGKEFTKVIVADYAKYHDKDKRLELKDNIKILYKDKKLKTSWILYDTKNSIVLDSKEFVILSDNMEVNGNHLFFDTKKDIIKAKDIKYKFRQ